MTVRVWFTPTDLGEAGYFVDFDRAEDYRQDKDDNLILLDPEESERGYDPEVGRVQNHRWDAAEIVLETASSDASGPDGE